MRKLPIIGNLLLLLLAGLFLFVDPVHFLPDRAAADAEKLNDYLKEQHERLEKLAAEIPLENISREAADFPGNLIQYKDEKAEFWLTNQVFPPENLRQLLDEQAGKSALFEAPVGKYLCWKPKAQGAGKTYGMIALLVSSVDVHGETIWRVPPEAGGNKLFIYDLLPAAETHTILSPDGKPLGTLNLLSELRHNNWWYALFTGFILLVIFFASTAYRSAQKLHANLQSGWRFLLDLVLLVLLFLCIKPFGESLIQTAPFAPSENIARLLSQLVSSSLLLVIMSLSGLTFWKEIPFPAKGRMFAISIYSGLVFGLFGLLKLTEYLVPKSGIDFYYQTFFSIQPAAWISIGVLLLLFSLILIWALRWLSIVIKLEPNQSKRMLAVLIATIIVSICFLLIGSKMSVMLFAVSAFGITVAIDLLAENQNWGFSQALFTIIIISALLSSLIYGFQNEEPGTRQEQIAAQLALQKDPLLVSLVEDIYTQLPETAGDTSQFRRLESSWRVSWNEHPYLSAYYEYDFVPDSTRDVISQDLATTNGLEYTSGPSPGYTLKIKQREIPMQSWRFGSFDVPSWRGLELLDRYDYSVYHKGKAVKLSKSSPFPGSLNLLSDEGRYVAASDQHYGRIYGAPDLENYDRFEYDNAYVVLMRLKGFSADNMISLAAFLVMFLLVFFPVLFLADQYIPLLPGDMKVNLSFRSSIGGRMHSTILALIVFTLTFSGWVTIKYFQQEANAELTLERQERLDSVFDQLLSTNQNEAPSATQVNRLAKAYRQEIRIYDAGGQLLKTSDGFLSGTGMIPQYIPWGYQQILKRSDKQYLEHVENIAFNQSKVVYRASMDSENAVQSIFGFPLSDISEINTEKIFRLISRLLIVYVFALLVAAALALYVSSTITRPMGLLRSSLGQVNLGKNEPIPYQSEDELGVLISEYNLMIEKLEEATRKLAQTERESTWREMARQVAHEIKNPITPMYLTIQQLERLMKDRPEDALRYLKQRTSTLIDQMENLSGIANAFSSFARMPKADFQEVHVGELLRSSYTLFENERKNIKFELEIPEEAFLVMADKKQMLGVFNNLYKNAIQAIPEDQEGLITTRLEAAEPKGLRISICDNGKGIPEEIRTKVFMPKFTTKSTGSGLGLAFSKNIILSFGGNINFETEEGKGTCFRIDLPTIN
ncbi:MAG: hypothetical protein GYB31_15280 [Bacteroidetes bacterium]|nr:hypothetical protein [Bacteroidota bacterium]